ncbi:hypothetical protein R6Q59_025982 [Mikania micrantha]
MISTSAKNYTTQFASNRFLSLVKLVKCRTSTSTTPIASCGVIAIGSFTGGRRTSNREKGLPAVYTEASDGSGDSFGQ